MQLGQLLFFDSSATVQEPSIPFEGAVGIGWESLSADADCLCAIDIGVARRDRYRPIPLRDPIARRSKPPPAERSNAANEILTEASQVPPEESRINSNGAGADETTNESPSAN